MKKIKDGLNIFGDVKSGGAIINISDVNAGIEMHKFILNQIAEVNNIPRTWELEVLIHNMARKLHAEQLEKIKKNGVAGYITTLLEAKDKKSAVKLASAMTMKHSDFAHLTYNFGDLGYEKESKFFEYVPEHLKPTDEEREAFSKSRAGMMASRGAQKFLKKISNTFKERKNVCAHLFTKGDEWHCFYFTYNDVYGQKLKGKNHWVEGDHIHYASYLWGRRVSDVWDALSKKHYSIENVHIRYLDERNT